MAGRVRLGESLLEAGLITRDQLDEALSRKLTTGERIGEALVALGYISERDLFRTLAGDADIPFLEPGELRADPMAASLLPAPIARANTAVPLREDGRALLVVMANPFDMGIVRTIERAAGRPVRAAAADPAEVAALVESVYGGGAALTQSPAATRQANEQAARARAGWANAGTRSGAVAAPPAPSVRAGTASSAGGPGEDGVTAAELADQIIRRGVTMGATDIHIEPLESTLRVRYRLDGILQDGPTLEKRLHPSLMSRIKILAGLDIAESRLPQDGRVRTRVDGRAVDMRVSTFPTVFGEDTVLRVLDRSRVTLQLESLGIEQEDVRLLRDAMAKPFGLVPVTGPTGSGKTTTLYAALMELNTKELCVITLEDPVEYEVELIRQSQINVRAGLTFASGLRSILRHDPDVVLVGEMRDQETVQIALSAALTGHLVLTTLHTTTAAGAIPRLLDMGAEPFIVASAVSLVASQRLVRVLCEQCKAKVELPAPVRKRFNIEDPTTFAARGCPACRQTGYRGRIGIFEFLPVTDDVVAAIYDRRPAEEIRRMSRRPTLMDDGLRKVQAGITTLDEVLRVTA